MVARIHPIRIHSAQILDLQFDQRARQFSLVAKSLCEVVCFKLVLSAQDVHQELDDCVHRGKRIREQDETNYDWELVMETKGLVQGTVVDEDREQGENVEEMELPMINNIFVLINSKVAYL